MTEEKYQRGYAVVDLSAIVSNMKNMKENLHPETKMMAVIKADGYGHGSVPIAHALQGLDFLYGFAVATYEEAKELRDEGITHPILVLGYTFPYAYEDMILQDIRPCVFRKDMAEEIDKIAAKRGRIAKVHLKTDTGMGRIGITPDAEGLNFVQWVNEKEHMEIEGIFTHFARADEADKTFAALQLSRFIRFAQKAEEEIIGKKILKHCSNSAGILEMPDANLDLVRAGITLYGLAPSDEVDMTKVPLTPALSLYSTVVFIKEVPAGFPVSYGSTFVSDKPMRIATIPLGYGDGYPRSLSGKGYVLICGKKAPILGRVCMDQFMVDVTDILEAHEGSKVTLIGQDGALCITTDELGDLSGRFNYEFVCDLGKRIPRIYIEK